MLAPVLIGAPSIPNPLGAGASEVIKWVVSGVTKAMNAFFSGLVGDALQPLLSLLGQTLLTTPDPASLPRVGQLWEDSRRIAVAGYVLLILAAAITVMAYETVQTRHGLKEIAPRIVVAFLAANLSLVVAGTAIDVVNAVATGLLGGDQPSAHAAAATLTQLVANALSGGGIFLILVGLGLAVMLVALLIGYAVRVAVTVLLLAGAPLALMCHALPQTDGIARWWWRALAGVLAIQVVQSLTLVAALQVFLTPGGFGLFGPTRSGLVDLLVATALVYVLYKVPFWVLQRVQVGGSRSRVVGALQGVLAYQALGVAGLRGSRAGAARTDQQSPRSGMPAGGRPGNAATAPIPRAQRRSTSAASTRHTRTVEDRAARPTPSRQIGAPPIPAARESSPARPAPPPPSGASPVRAAGKAPPPLPTRSSVVPARPRPKGAPPK